jgi:hypothetical protein
MKSFTSAGQGKTSQFVGSSDLKCQLRSRMQMCIAPITAETIEDRLREWSEGHAKAGH